MRQRVARTLRFSAFSVVVLAFNACGTSAGNLAVPATGSAAPSLVVTPSQLGRVQVTRRSVARRQLRDVVMWWPPDQPDAIDDERPQSMTVSVTNLSDTSAEFDPLNVDQDQRFSIRIPIGYAIRIVIAQGVDCEID